MTRLWAILETSDFPAASASQRTEKRRNAAHSKRFATIKAGRYSRQRLECAVFPRFLLSEPADDQSQLLCVLGIRETEDVIFTEAPAIDSEREPVSAQILVKFNRLVLRDYEQ